MSYKIEVPFWIGEEKIVKRVSFPSQRHAEFWARYLLYEQCADAITTLSHRKTGSDGETETPRETLEALKQSPEEFDAAELVESGDPWELSTKAMLAVGAEDIKCRPDSERPIDGAEWWQHHPDKPIEWKYEVYSPAAKEFTTLTLRFPSPRHLEFWLQAGFEGLLKNVLSMEFPLWQEVKKASASPIDFETLADKYLEPEAGEFLWNYYRFSNDTFYTPHTPDGSRGGVWLTPPTAVRTQLEIEEGEKGGSEDDFPPEV